MKSSHFMMGVLLIPALMLTCCTEDAHVADDKVNLTFNVDLMESSEGQMKAAQIPPGAVALISIETDRGELVVDQEEVAIIQSNDGYVTAPLHLRKDNYRVVDLMIIDESGEVVFVAPRAGSEVSEKVTHSLPYNVSDETRIDTRLTLLDARKKAPRHFGYDCFRGKQHTFKVQVYTAEENNTLHRASAQALIMKDLDTLRMYRLENNMNFITFRGTPGETYTLVVVKDSYARFAKDFNINQIPAKPLKVILQPALSVVGVTTGDQNYFGFQLDPAWDYFDFHVDWGDGISEVWPSGITTSVEHFYAHPGTYYVSVTGHGLDSVVLVGNLAGAGRIARLGMKHLVNLTDFRIEFGPGPEVVDLKHNRRLNVVAYYPHSFDANPTLRKIMIPNDANIYQLELVNCTNLEAESLNGVIDAIHHQIVTKGRLYGDFIYHTWEDPNAPVATPSEASLEKLREMKHTYNWLVVPDPDGIPF